MATYNKGTGNDVEAGTAAADNVAGGTGNDIVVYRAASGSIANATHFGGRIKMHARKVARRRSAERR